MLNGDILRRRVEQRATISEQVLLLVKPTGRERYWTFLLQVVGDRSHPRDAPVDHDCVEAIANAIGNSFYGSLLSICRENSNAVWVATNQVDAVNRSGASASTSASPFGSRCWYTCTTTVPEVGPTGSMTLRSKMCFQP